MFTELRSLANNYVDALRFHWPSHIPDGKGVSDKKCNPSHQMFSTRAWTAGHKAIACTGVCVKQFVMSLPAMSLRDWFSVSRKGGTGGGVLVYTPKG